MPHKALNECKREHKKHKMSELEAKLRKKEKMLTYLLRDRREFMLTMIYLSYRNQSFQNSRIKLLLKLKVELRNVRDISKNYSNRESLSLMSLFTWLYCICLSSASCCFSEKGF